MPYFELYVLKKLIIDPAYYKNRQKCFATCGRSKLNLWLVENGCNQSSGFK